MLAAVATWATAVATWATQSTTASSSPPTSSMLQAEGAVELALPWPLAPSLRQSPGGRPNAHSSLARRRYRHGPGAHASTPSDPHDCRRGQHVADDAKYRSSSPKEHDDQRDRNAGSPSKRGSAICVRLRCHDGSCVNWPRTCASLEGHRLRTYITLCAGRTKPASASAPSARGVAHGAAFLETFFETISMGETHPQGENDATEPKNSRSQKEERSGGIADGGANCGVSNVRLGSTASDEQTRKISSCRHRCLPCRPNSVPRD